MHSTYLIGRVLYACYLDFLQVHHSVSHFLSNFVCCLQEHRTPTANAILESTIVMKHQSGADASVEL